MDDKYIEQIKRLKIHTKEIIACLNGNNLSLARIFDWYRHPFGHDFWHNAYIKSRQNNQLTQETRDELERILAIKELT